MKPKTKSPYYLPPSYLAAILTEVRVKHYMEINVCSDECKIIVPTMTCESQILPEFIVSSN